MNDLVFVLLFLYNLPTNLVMGSCCCCRKEMALSRRFSSICCSSPRKGVSFFVFGSLMSGRRACGNIPNQTAICVTNTFCGFVLWLICAPVNLVSRENLCVVRVSIVQICDTNSVSVPASLHHGSQLQGLDLI